MTLIEVLMGAVVSVIVAGAAYSVIMAATQSRIRTTMRMETMSRGRDGMEQVTRLLRAQACYLDGAPLAVLYAASDSVAFYSTYLDGSGVEQPDIVQIEWIPNGVDLRDSGGPVGDIQMTRFLTTRTTGAAVTWQDILTRSDLLYTREPTRVIASDVSRVGATASVRGTDIFVYYNVAQASATSPASLSTTAVPAASMARAAAMPQLASGLTYAGYFDGAAQGSYGDIAGIQVNFTARARSTRVVKSNSVTFSNRVTMITSAQNQNGTGSC